MNSQIYNMRKLDQIDDIELIETFVIAYQKDDRSLYTVKELLNRGTKIKNLIVFKYPNNSKSDNLFEELEIDKIYFIDDLFNVQNLVKSIKSNKEILEKESFYLDISCLNTPELFIVMRYLKILKPAQKICILYSIPFDYQFENEPFTSFVSYAGDLETKEIIGYSGNSEKTLNADLLVFMGFEGALSFKVIEDINYNELILVNGLPSFFQKYKDISVINNFDVITPQKRKIHYVPADNPFEVYNLIEEIANGRSGLCIAPLSTKPVALGVCLYALKHTDVRIVYPTSTMLLRQNITNSVHETLIYDIFL